MVRPIDQETTAIEKMNVILTDPKKRGHTTSWGTQREELGLVKKQRDRAKLWARALIVVCI